MGDIILPAVIKKEDVRSAVWDSTEVTPPSGSYGERFITNLNATISSRAVPLTFEKYADMTLAGGASYTPTKTGFFSWYMGGGAGISEYYSTGAAIWYSPMRAWLDHVAKGADFNPQHQEIGDGTNYRIRNTSAASERLILMRAGYSTPNPSPKVGKQILYGKPSIVLESDEKGFIWIEEEELLKLLVDIKADVDDKMGYGRYKGLLRGLGYDV